MNKLLVPDLPRLTWSRTFFFLFKFRCMLVSSEKKKKDIRFQELHLVHFCDEIYVELVRYGRHL